MNMPDTPLSLEELHELDEFLADEVIEETSMDVSTLEGFMTALAIGPRTVRPSEWLPWVWDMQEGQVEAEFESESQANRIMSLILRHNNTLIRQFHDDPAFFEPVFWSGAQWGAAEWSEGFLLGFQFNEELWSLLMAGQPTWFTPFLRLGTDEGLVITKDHGDAERWMNEIVPSLVKIHAYWKGKRNSQPAGLIENDFRIGGHKAVTQVIRQGSKVGRNDPCPCGSGKKFKKCCGIEEPSGTVH